MTIKRSAAQKEALKFDDLMSEFIDKSHLVFIKKEDSVTLITERNKGKGKSKEKTGFKCLYYDKIRYKKINCFYKYPEKASFSWKSEKDGAQRKRNEIVDNISFIFFIIRNTGQDGHTSSVMIVCVQICN